MNRYLMNKHNAENALRESLNEERGCQKQILNESGNAYSAGRHLYRQIKKLEENVVASYIKEGVEFVFGKENNGGMVIFSTDINAISPEKNLFSALKNWAKTFFNRVTSNKRLNDIAEKYSPEGWTVGHFLRGRYKARNGKVFDENSISLEIIGLDTDQMVALAEEICNEFDQETVLLKDYTSEDVILINGEKETLTEGMTFEEAKSLIASDIKKNGEPTNKLLKESKISRIFDYIDNKDKSFAIISANRSDVSKEDNVANYAELKKLIREMDLGFIEFIGGYRETVNGETIEVVEPSILVPNITKEDAIKLGQKYGQEAILYKDGCEMAYISTSGDNVGEITDKFVCCDGKNNMKIDDILNPYFSRLKKGSHRNHHMTFVLSERVYNNELSRKGFSGGKASPVWTKCHEYQLNESSSKKISWLDMLNKMEELGYDYTGDYNFIPDGYKTKQPLYRFDYNHKEGTTKLSVQDIKDAFGGNVTVLRGGNKYAPEQSFILMTNKVFDSQKAINESTINRVKKWFEEKECACISAFRDKLVNVTNKTFMGNEENDFAYVDNDEENPHKFDRKENQWRSKYLKRILLKYGYGVTSQTGVFAEKDKNGNNKEEGNETSFLVVNLNNDPDFFDVLFDLSEFFNQDSFLYKKPNSEKAYFIGTNASGYKSQIDAGVFKPVADEGYLSKIGAKAYQFRREHSKSIDESYEYAIGADTFNRQSGFTKTIIGYDADRYNKTKNSFQKMNESSLGRVFDMIIREDCVFGIVSAFRKDLSNNVEEQNELNEERHAELKNEVRKMGYGFTELRGAYKEEGYDGTDIFEKSLIIGKIDRDEIIELGKKYNQDSVIWHGDGKFELIEADGSVSNFVKDSIEVKQEAIKELNELADKDPEKFKKLFIVGSWLTRGTKSHQGKKFSFLFEARMNPSVNRGMIEKKFGAEKTWKDRFTFDLDFSSLNESPELKEDILSHIHQDYGENLTYDAILYYYYNDEDEWNPWRGEKDLYVQNRVDTKEKAEEVEAAVNEYMMDHEHEWMSIEEGDRKSVIKFYKELTDFIDSQINN